MTTSVRETTRSRTWPARYGTGTGISRARAASHPGSQHVAPPTALRSDVRMTIGGPMGCEPSSAGGSDRLRVLLPNLLAAVGLPVLDHLAEVADGSAADHDVDDALVGPLRQREAP